MSIAHGLKTHVVKFQKRTTTYDDTQAPIETWSDVNDKCSVPCHLSDSPPMRRDIGDQAGQLYNAVAKFDHDPELNERNRIVFNNQVYDFVGVENLQNLNRAWFVYLMCKTTQANLGRNTATNNRKKSP